MSLKCIKEISSVGYEIENYDYKAKYKAKDKGCEKIRRHLIVDLEEYNI